MKNQQQMLATEPVGKLLLKYSVPAIIGMIVNALYNVVDRIFIGNIPGVGALAITGVGVTMPIMTIILAFGMLIGIGSTANISIKLGQGKRDDAEIIIREFNYSFSNNRFSYKYYWYIIWRCYT